MLQTTVKSNAVAVLEKHLLQTLVVRGACLEVVGRIEVEQGHLLDLAGNFMVLP